MKSKDRHLVKRVLFTLNLFLPCFPSLSQDCNNLPGTFASFRDAKMQIQTSMFRFQDVLPPRKGSWMKKALFKSCDGMTGFMLYTTNNGKEYIHSGIPIDVWYEFKNATSCIAYYDQNIRHKYMLLKN